MRGLVPRIHVFAARQDVDGRVKPGHDGVSFHWIEQYGNRGAGTQSRRALALVRQ
jgi:hypothetical protein